MPNPWLSIPLADYEGHMESAEVQQLGVLSDLFAEALAFCRPSSVAVLGIAGGNGLQRIDPNITTRTVGLDVNPSYLHAVRRRYAFMRCLELHCADLSGQLVSVEPVQLVHAAVVFEHAGVGLCLENAISLVAPGGALSVVLQLPSETEQAVSASCFPSVQNLKDHFSFVSPACLRERLKERQFLPQLETQHSSPAGKGFWMGVFRQK